MAQNWKNYPYFERRKRRLNKECLERGENSVSETRKEKRQIKFRVNEQEFQQLEASASSVGMTVPAFAKSKVQGKRIKAPRIEREGAFEVAKQLRYYNSNLNQLVKWVNSNKGLHPETNLTEMEQQLTAIREGIDDLWEQLSR